MWPGGWYAARMKLAWMWMLVCGMSVAQMPLQAKLSSIATEARGKVQVACSLPGTTLSCDLDAQAHPPMQSVFKLPLTMAVMSRLVETGKMGLDAPVKILPSDRFAPTYSPLQDRYPTGTVEVPLREVMRLTVSQSDNVGSEMLLRLVGGPVAVEDYMRGIGVTDFQLKDGEKRMHGDQTLQYRNWWAPASAVATLEKLYEGKALGAEGTKLVLEWMRETETGPKRLKAGLPPGTILMHKTGSSGEEGGLEPATNDIGLTVLPDGRVLTLAVFVTDARANQEAVEGVIAKVAAAVYESALHQSTR